MGNLFARGNHANIQFQIDGVPLPDSVSGLFGGFLSPRLVENMEVITGGLDAEYGDRARLGQFAREHRGRLPAGSGELRHAQVDLTLSHLFFDLPSRPTVAIDVLNLFDAHYAYRIANGFNGSHFAPGRSVFLRISSDL